MAAAHALSVPELLLNIFQPLQNETFLRYPALANAARVNSTWFECATEMMWGDRDRSVCMLHPRHLYDVGEDRRQIYASKIQGFLFRLSRRHPDFHAAFEDLHFPRLRSLAIDAVGREDGPPAHIAARYLCPLLEDLQFWMGSAAFADGLLATLNEKCPRLRKVMFADLGLENQISPTQLVEFFHGRSLVDIHIDEDPSLISLHLMVELSQMRGLRKLEIRNRMATSHLKEMVGKQRLVSKPDAERTFRDLLELRLNLETKALAYIPLVFSNLVKAELAIRGDKHNFFQYLGFLEHLKELTVQSDDDHLCIPRLDLIHLQMLKKLESLTLTTCRTWLRRPYSPSLKDLDFAFIFGAMPMLKMLEFDVDCPNITTIALLCLSKHCPLLESVKLPMAFSMQSLRSSSRPMFPNLSDLKLGASKVPGMPENFTPPQIAEIIHAHMPRLSTIEFLEEGSDSLVARVWEDMYCHIDAASYHLIQGPLRTDLEHRVTRGERISDIESHHWISETGTEEIWSESDSDSSDSEESDRDYASEDEQDVSAVLGVGKQM